MADFRDIPTADMAQAVEEAFGKYSMVEDVNSYNFVCPYCGQMPNSEFKKPERKAYVYKDTWNFVCYKCRPMHHVMWEFYDNDELKYLFNRLVFTATTGAGGKVQDTQKHVRQYVDGAYPFKDGELVSLEEENDPDVQIALAECKRRRIREKVYKEWFVCKKDKRFLDKNPDGTLKLNAYGLPTGNEYGGRLIIPYYRFGGSWVQFDARDLTGKSKMRYRNYAGAKRELYNGDFLHFNKLFFMLEGAIDSTFIKNSVAVGGLKHFKSFVEANPNFKEYKENGVIIFDADEAGIDDLRTVMNMGFRWFDWSKFRNDNPQSNDFGGKVKDINEAVLNCSEFKMTPDGYVDPEFIMAHTYSAEAGIMLLNMKYGLPKKR